MTGEERRRAKSRKRHEKRANKKRHTVSNILLLIAVFVFCFAGFKIIAGEREYKKGRDEYVQIREEAKPESGEEDKINWKKLRKINPDIVAWIRFDAPKTIDYPVVQGKDNNIYLHKSFGENYIKAGTIYINCDNKPDLTDANTFVYGHNMNDGSMFAKLKKYEEKSFCDKHPYFYIYTPDDVKHVYRIFAAGTYDQDSKVATQYKFADDETYGKHLEEIKKGAYYETGITPGTDDRIVTLYTCTNVRQQDRRLVFGVEVTGKTDAAN